MNEQMYQPRRQGPSPERKRSPELGQTIAHVVLGAYHLELLLQAGAPNEEIFQLATQISDELNRLPLFLGAPGEKCPRCNGSGRKRG